jgi:hypothetical protein
MNSTHLSPEEIAIRRRETASHILGELQLIERWSRFGRPVIVGAFAYDLMFARDIDFEIYCPRLRIDDGFDVLRACAVHPSVTQTQFINALNTPDQALYWQIRCRDHEDEEWKIDMWSAPEDYPLPRGENLVGPILRALTPESRRAILNLKAAMRQDPTLACVSIHLYRAVISDGIRTIDQWRAWLAASDTDGLSDWRP